jgi:hypothetical protein
MLAAVSTNTELGPGSNTIKMVPSTKVVRSVMPYTVRMSVMLVRGLDVQGKRGVDDGVS